MLNLPLKFILIGKMGMIIATTSKRILLPYQKKKGYESTYELMFMHIIWFLQYLEIILEYMTNFIS